jgi:hypothetical protein
MNPIKDIKPDFGEPAHQAEKNKARHQWISVAAYYKAQARGFAAGLELDDWLAAENEYFEMLIASYLSIAEEDGGMTILSLRQLAKAIGVQNPERLHLKVDIIRAIQDISRTHSCFQLDPSDLCDGIADCQWNKECRKMIAIWQR